jgi:site-specific recombinase XerD
MAEKRKDNKGRVLKSGESQRKDSTYMYRYTDIFGKRKYVYAQTLQELREKEANIQKDLIDGIDSTSGDMTVHQLVKKHLSLKQGMRKKTMSAYLAVANVLEQEEFGHRKVAKVKPSDAKKWVVEMSEKGYMYNTIGSMLSVIRPAFQMAIEDNIIRKNPFNFELSSVITKKANRRKSLTEDEKNRYLEYIKNSGYYAKYYDEIVILLGTGLRVSELYGLTIKDIDFEGRKIKVERQLMRVRDTRYYVQETKTENGVRFVPMTTDVYDAFKRVIKNRNPKVETMVDGVTGFVFLTQNGVPKIAQHLSQQMKRALDHYNRTHESQLPSITPHVLRHTFCTNMAMKGMNMKTLQYIMGHSDISVTLNVYTHASYEDARAAIEQIESKIVAN